MPSKKGLNCKRNKEIHPKTRKCVNKCNPGKSRNRNYRCTSTKTKSVTKKNNSRARSPPRRSLSTSSSSSFNTAQSSVSSMASFKTAQGSPSAPTIVFPTPAVDDPSITKDDTTAILNLINRYSSEGAKYQEEGIPYHLNSVLSNLLYLYLIETYGFNCFIRGDMNSIYYYGLVLHGSLSKKAQINYKKTLYKQIRLILNCIKRIQSTNEEIIIIPLNMVYGDQAHANMLIYRKSVGTIDHFEPHGYEFANKDKLGNYIRNKVPIILQTIIDKMNTINKESNYTYYKENLEYYHPALVCPSTFGVQSIESQLVIPTKVKETEKKGFCLMWSYFWAEMVLLNPHIRSHELTGYILDSLDYDIDTFYDKPTNMALKTRNVMRGYLEFIYVKINNMIENIDPGQNMKSYIERGEIELTNQFDKIVEKLDKYYNISRRIFGQISHKQQEDKFNEYLDEQFKKYNDVSFDEYKRKPASKSFSELSL